MLTRKSLVGESKTANSEKGKYMSLTLMGRKKGMMQAFDDKGNIVVCTVIHAEPNVVTMIKNKETDGYESVQLSSGKLSPSKVKNVTKPRKGFFTKINVEPRRHLKESRIESSEQFAVGQEVGVNYFSDCNFVDVSSISKGKGHQGVIKRHNFAGGPAAHGSGFHRHGGSTGQRTTPGRCLPGQKKSGRMGGEAVTIQNLRIVKVDEEKQVILVEGAVPGSRESLVYISKAKKISASKNKKG